MIHDFKNFSCNLDILISTYYYFVDFLDISDKEFTVISEILLWILCWLWQEEDYGSGYLVQPVSQAEGVNASGGEDYEDADVAEDIEEEEDDEDGEIQELPPSSSYKRKRDDDDSSNDSSDDDGDGDEDEDAEEDDIVEGTKSAKHWACKKWRKKKK